jgi:antitoxin component of RelBE/YafQ-DinJ toxin-antitoxin module
MNITLAVDEAVVERARKVAESLGKSLNQLVRDYLAEVANARGLEEDVGELRRLSAASGGRAAGWRFNRDELHGRP